MRELKFRIWDKKYNEYVTNERNCIDWSVYSMGDLFEYKDRLIIEQYTGLKDKNGKEIYEGDIIDCNSDGQEIWYVKYNAPHYELIDEFGFTMFLEEAPRRTTIGNIHENPELLKKSVDKP